ncbi:TetR family transcriptional regulator C-terminal domain-containing protein [Mycobacterium sp. JS623]|uniref:TetR family transcriptional regulator C-terminal domain-containing protein n=1 Tax=Mycobacterium sp. JS623 TaxID=212767 RepID=UPI00031A85E7|nr:TetR family transcriptional regulator C-terminal domain-containing protein [Mycobacterium sp. JS623]
MITAAHHTIEQGRPIAIGYLEAWTQAQRSPQLRELRDQLAGYYREFRAGTVVLVTSESQGHNVLITDPEALSAVLVAVADGLFVQWLLDPEVVPDPTRLARILEPLLPTT